MNRQQAEALESAARSFLTAHDDLRGLAVCGSWARGNPRSDSDLDLLIVARDTSLWKRRTEWINAVPFRSAGFRYIRHIEANYGVAWSLHIELEPDAKLELTFVDESWTQIDPIDAGTKRVVDDAIRISVDKDGAIARLVKSCGKTVTQVQT